MLRGGFACLVAIFWSLWLLATCYKIQNGGSFWILSSGVGRAVIVGLWWGYAFFTFLAVSFCARNIRARLYNDPFLIKPSLLKTQVAVLLCILVLLITYLSEDLALYALLAAALLLIAASVYFLIKVHKARHFI